MILAHRVHAKMTGNHYTPLSLFTACHTVLEDLNDRETIPLNSIKMSSFMLRESLDGNRDTALQFN